MKSEDFFSQQKCMELNRFLASHETVDGRNPIAVGYELTLPSYLHTGSQMVQDFFHQEGHQPYNL